MTPRQRHSQRLDALTRANKIRDRRKRLKLRLKAGRVTLASVLRANAEYTRTMRLRELLLATPGIGVTKADRALRVVNLSHLTQLRALTATDREVLLAYIAERFPAVGETQVAA